VTRLAYLEIECLAAYLEIECLAAYLEIVCLADRRLHALRYVGIERFLVLAIDPYLQISRAKSSY
jgi:hypothetical protein